jgi:hypothetical protein
MSFGFGLISNVGRSDRITRHERDRSMNASDIPDPPTGILGRSGEPVRGPEAHANRMVAQRSSWLAVRLILSREKNCDPCPRCLRWTVSADRDSGLHPSGIPGGSSSCPMVLCSRRSDPMTRKRTLDEADPERNEGKRHRVPRGEQDEWQEWRAERGRRGRKPFSKRQEGRRRVTDDMV